MLAILTSKYVLLETGTQRACSYSLTSCPFILRLIFSSLLVQLLL